MIKKSIKVQFINFALILSMLLSIISAGLMPVQVYALDETVLYVNAEGSGEMDGSSAANAMTLRNAYAQIAEQGETDVTRIIVCGPVLVKDHLELVTGKTTEYYFPKHAGKVILTGEGDGAGLNFEKLSFYFQGDTTVEQIAILEKANNVYADYQPLHLGENVTGTFASTVYLGTTNAMFTMGTVTIGDAEFSMKSGTITTLYGGGSYYQGSALAGRKYTISLELSGGTVTTLYGSGWGATDNPGHKSIHILVNGATVTTLYGAHSSATVDEDIQIVLESGTVGTVYGACEYTETAKPNYTPTIHNVEIEVGNAAVTSLNAEKDNANITGSKILHYRNASGANMASGSGFDTLKLTNSTVTVPSGMAAIWNGITSLSLTDNSVLTLAETPAVAEKSVAVTAVRSGTEWNTSGAVILAPVGTPDIFTLASPTDCELVYASDADGASWTLRAEATVPETVLYVNAEGSGEMDGSSAANAMTLRNAYAQIAEQGETDVTRIIVCGPVLVKDHLELVTGKTTEYYFPKHAGKVILTGEGDGAGLNFEKLSFYFQGDTTVEQIAILEKANNVYADYQPLHLGENVTGTFASTVYLGTTNAMFTMGTVTIGDAEFSMKSGTITTLYGGGSYYQGSALAGRKYTISLELSGGTVTTLYGSGWGATDNPGHKSIHILVNGATVTTLYGAHSSATVDEDIQIVLESGTVGTVYGACEYTETAKPNYTPTIHNVEIEVGNAAVTSLNAEKDNANITGSKILHYRNASGANMASGSGFDTLKLTNSTVTVPSGMAAIWNGITSLSLTDNSVLTLAETPAVAEKSVAVTAVRSGTEWNTSGAVILAPAGTPDIFTLVSPIDHELVYASDADGASWTLRELAEFPIGEKTGTEAKTMDIALNLPDGTNYTPLEADATAYETYLAKLQDLEAVGAKDEVRVISPVEIKGEIALYVAPNGNDENSGSKDAPVATIAKALQLVESIQELVDPPKGIIVYLRAGTYVANEPITLGKVHSGVNGMPVIISAYADEEVVITGGTDIDGSHFQAVQEVSAEAYQKLPVAVRDRVVAVKLGDLGISEFGSISGGVQGGPNYQIFVDGEELTLARYPNAENLSLTGNVLHVGAITAPSSVLGPQGTNADDPDVRFEMTDLRPTLWENDGNIWLKGALYAEWDITNIRVKDIDSKNGVMRLDGGCGYGARKMVTNTYYYYNILEELDIPGEYYLDTANGILYLVPIGDMAEATVTFSAMQNNLINLNQTENVILNGLTIENCAKYGIYMNNCTQTLVQNCVIRNVGTGVKIHGTKSGVIYSDIEGIANRPVEISQSQTVFDYTPELNFLQNCYIHSTGTKNEKYCGVYVQGTGNVVSHNLVQGTFSVAIYVQYAKECIVEYNEITGGPTGTYDGGAIYQPYHPSDTGNHIRYNYIHDIAAFSDKHNPCAIYFDEGLTGNCAYGNIMSNLPCGFFTNSGSENVIVHNVVMDGRAGTQSGIRGESNFPT